MKTKIVLDADVIIHFIKAGQLYLLLDIFPEYEYLILDVVYEEITQRSSIKTQIDNLLNYFPKRISNIIFKPEGNSRLEYALLRNKFGKGESACMVYCRDNNDVLGSSNLKDIKDYCNLHKITYLTTLDFLYYAYIRKKITKKECDSIIHDILSKGSKLPDIDITSHTPNCML